MVYKKLKSNSQEWKYVTEDQPYGNRILEVILTGSWEPITKIEAFLALV
jgi:hypothetical protein